MGLTYERVEDRRISLLINLSFYSFFLLFCQCSFLGLSFSILCLLLASKINLYILSSLLADISDCAVVILSESIEKHDRNVYEMGAETLSNEQRATIFSKVLGKPINYEQQSIEEFYKTYTNFGMPHSLVYNLISYFLNSKSDTITPQLALIIGRPLRTLEEWLKENVEIFQ